MLRTFFAGLGVLFALILVFLTSFLGRVLWDMRSEGPAYERLAVEITRDLSRSWSVNDIKQHYALPVAHKLSSPAAQRAFDALKPLGGLRYVDGLTHRTRWRQDSIVGLRSPADAAELIAETLRKSVRVTFVAKFDNGFADVTIEFRSEGGAMKVWSLRIDSQEDLPAPSRSLPLAISRA